MEAPCLSILLTDEDDDDMNLLAVSASEPFKENQVRSGINMIFDSFFKVAVEFRLFIHIRESLIFFINYSYSHIYFGVI